jgi:predicted lipoprotein with Yx(FWY)xxD motif
MVAMPEISREHVRSGRLAGRAKLAAVLAGVALMGAACGSKTAAGTTTTSAAPAGGGATTVALKTASVGSAGTVLVDSKGFTLYTYSLDKPGKIACVQAACVSSWPPLVLPSGDHLATMSGLSTEARPDGEMQVTYHGSPLYTFSGDSKAGQDNGVGIADWSVAKVGSATVTGTSPTTTASTGGGGYGY